MSISNFFQFILGFILGVCLLVAGSVGAAFYFFNRMASAPPKPVFSETLSEPTSEQKVTAAGQQENNATPAAIKEEEPEEDIPANAYKAKVTWSSGLSLRAEPSPESERIGGVDYNAEVLVLSESDDKVWQKIRLNDGTEAWVKAGNVEKIN